MTGGAEGLLLLGGEGPRRAQLEEVLRAASLVIAADSGFDLAGGGGGRLDPLLAVAGLFQRKSPPLAWYTALERIERVDGEAELSGCLGRRVSFFPLGQAAGGLSSEGLKWPLDGLEWARGQGGISNLVTSDPARGRGRRGGPAS